MRNAHQILKSANLSFVLFVAISLSGVWKTPWITNNNSTSYKSTQYIPWITCALPGYDITSVIIEGMLSERCRPQNLEASTIGSLKISVTAPIVGQIWNSFETVAVSGVWTFRVLSRWTVICPYLSNLLSRYLELPVISLFMHNKHVQMRLNIKLRRCVHKMCF